ncbi:unnamed protein product [Zymoseptoria tritici ST99CH_1A5]|uniref:Uncharacterized protein n=3 Tax=Zymoseptoria tritici TaxID=1047171 RepID=F9X8V7_ZYMTI|nr:uncharacterized protein MYCGRDRAFT_92445 [Zymoseptoria tritici IPO323]EGP87905.1 hypothetical protein MYCGRDRAFT_92445 [Zymoseptoria tritici IPO323]SMR50765.1 unnamed protein product [Zymoseptoria tritici ST99CH_1E4]SMR51706.1 unnamed protein product [Zymoseptoria tritici ST99CH_3D1]SMY23469.1 unnamed protein product [Zymoseptoria tritici ST99CH_1A5]
MANRDRLFGEEQFIQLQPDELSGRAWPKPSQSTSKRIDKIRPQRRDEFLNELAFVPPPPPTTTRKMSGKRGDDPLRQYGGETDGRYPKFTPTTTARAPPENEFAEWRTRMTPPAPRDPPVDYINPRPAIRQRYVSAGGTAKLSDRAEIEAPVTAAPTSFTSSPPRHSMSDFFPSQSTADPPSSPIAHPLSAVFPIRPESTSIRQRYVSAGGTIPLADRPEVEPPTVPPSILQEDVLVPSMRLSSADDERTRNDSFVASRTSKDTRPPQTPDNKNESENKRNRDRTRSSASARLSKLKRWFSSSSGPAED